MGQKKINQLAAAGAITGSELFEIEQSSNSRKVTWNELLQPVTSSESGAFTVGNAAFQVISWTVGASDVDATLPALSTGTSGDSVEIHKVDSGAGRGTIACDAGDGSALDGVASFPLLLSQYNHIRIRHMGSYWHITELTSNGLVGDGTQTDPYLKLTLHANGDAFQSSNNVIWSNGPIYNYNFTYVSGPAIQMSPPDNQGGQAYAHNQVGVSTFQVVDASAVAGYHVHIAGRWRT